MGGRRALVLGCVGLVLLPLEACDPPPALAIVVPSAPAVYVTNNQTVNVYPPATAAPAASAPPSAEPPPSPPPAPPLQTIMPPRRAEPTQRASVGVIECDQYIARLERCTAGMRDKFETMLDTMWESYKFAARTSDGRKSLAIGCRGGLKMIDCEAPP